jgi:hypothetical protein
MANARYTGGCACGQVKYEIAGEPTRMVNCHCRDCQRASGSAYAAILGFERAAMKLTVEVKYFAVTSERGTQLERGFCPNCGSPVTVKPGARPDAIYVHAASLDDPALHQPTAQIWVRSAPPWDHIDPRIPHFDTRPPQ